MATKKTTKKAEEAKKTVKEAVKETEKKVAAKVETKKAEKKAPAAKKVEKAVEKKVEKKAEKKAPAKKPAKKAAAPKALFAPSVKGIFFEYGEKQVDAAALADMAKAAYKENGGKAIIRTMELYVKAEDNALYYVINGKENGKVEL